MNFYGGTVAFDALSKHLLEKTDKFLVVQPTYIGLATSHLITIYHRLVRR
jgi:hypothetical protein